MAAPESLAPASASTTVRSSRATESSASTTPPRQTTAPAEGGRPTDRSEPSRSAEPQTGGPLGELRESVTRSRRHRTSALDAAIAAAQALLRVEAIDDAEWVTAARALRSAAVERRRSSPRVASVALLLSDALGFTDPATLAIADRVPLRVGCEVLMQPFVSTDDERRVFAALLEHRWYVTGAFDADGFAAAAGAA